MQLNSIFDSARDRSAYDEALLEWLLGGHITASNPTTGAAFDAELDRCAEEQFAMVADLTDSD